MHNYEEEIILISGKCWQIEVFFKICKSMLNLIGECHGLSYDALTAHVTIVFTRYICLQWSSAKMKIRERLVNSFSSLLMKWQTLIQQITWHPNGCLTCKPSGNLKTQ